MIVEHEQSVANHITQQLVDDSTNRRGSKTHLSAVSVWLLAMSPDKRQCDGPERREQMHTCCLKLHVVNNRFMVWITLSYSPGNKNKMDLGLVTL